MAYETDYVTVSLCDAMMENVTGRFIKINDLGVQRRVQLLFLEERGYL